MWQALGDSPVPCPVGTVAHQAVGLVELLAAGDRWPHRPRVLRALAYSAGGVSHQGCW